MIILEDNFNEVLKNHTYIALGSFDGLHLGHMSLINKAIDLAKKSHGTKSMVYTFKNHPLTIINEEMVPKLLCSNEYKIELLEKSELEILNLVNFNIEYMKLSPEKFVENLLKHYGVEGLVVGFNYRFGYKNLGDIDLLKKLSVKFGFKLYIMDAVKLYGEIISSSKIRHFISEGEVHEANKLLGRPYMLEGKVIKGKQLGRTIGFPTINLDYDKSFLLPSGGVYYTIVDYNGVLYKGITNVGFNPTVDGKKLSIETYILDFDKFIYGENVRVYFKNKFRDEKKFDSLDELIFELRKDKLYAEKQEIEI
ncbi:MAG: bifunctional riboflavin kinase/FAD synthetase [Clostridiaceae bacterium]|nr:bifunctional riboflavin kinase/FAD synthetase [Clostridiaceae bacterium]